MSYWFLQIFCVIAILQGVLLAEDVSEEIERYLQRLATIIENNPNTFSDHERDIEMNRFINALVAAEEAIPEDKKQRTKKHLKDLRGTVEVVEKWLKERKELDDVLDESVRSYDLMLADQKKNGYIDLAHFQLLVAQFDLQSEINNIKHLELDAAIEAIRLMQPNQSNVLKDLRAYYKFLEENRIVNQGQLWKLIGSTIF